MSNVFYRQLETIFYRQHEPGFSDFYVKFVTPALNAETSPTASFFIYSPFVLRMMPAMDLGGVIS